MSLDTAALFQREHPAPFSNAVLAVIVEHVGPVGVVLDPFAGTGRIHELRLYGVGNTIGVEIEPEWAGMHPDTMLGNALDLRSRLPDGLIDAIVTSPTYGNRMADHHNATDDSVRHTYRHTLGRDLDADNSGALQWGDTYRLFHERAWTSVLRTLKDGGTFTLNIKNHVRKGGVQRVAEWHISTLLDMGLRLELIDAVPTRGLPAGSNGDARVPCEFVVTLRKPELR